MEKILYIVAAFLTTFWLIGVIWYAIGGLIHILLFMAMISFLAEYMSSQKKSHN